MVTKKFVVLFTIIMLLINDAVLVGGYFYFNPNISEVEAVNKPATDEPENDGGTEDNIINIDECFGTYHIKGLQMIMVSRMVGIPRLLWDAIAKIKPAEMNLQNDKKKEI